MTVRYLDDEGVVQTVATVTGIQPVGTLQLLIETAAVKIAIKVTQLIDITP